MAILNLRPPAPPPFTTLTAEPLPNATLLTWDAIPGLECILFKSTDPSGTNKQSIGVFSGNSTVYVHTSRQPVYFWVRSYYRPSQSSSSLFPVGNGVLGRTVIISNKTVDNIEFTKAEAAAAQYGAAILTPVPITSAYGAWSPYINLLDFNTRNAEGGAFHNLQASVVVNISNIVTSAPTDRLWLNAKFIISDLTPPGGQVAGLEWTYLAFYRVGSTTKVNTGVIHFNQKLLSGFKGELQPNRNFRLSVNFQKANNAGSFDASAETITNPMVTSGDFQ